MEQIPVSEFKKVVGECVNQVAYAKKRYILQKHGKDVAALVPVEDAKKLEDSSSWETDRKLGRLYDFDKEKLVKLIEKTGAENLTELLDNALMASAIKEIKAHIDYDRKK